MGPTKTMAVLPSLAKDEGGGSGRLCGEAGVKLGGRENSDLIYSLDQGSDAHPANDAVGFCRNIHT